MDNDQIRISASEIADYVYCRRCWFFRLRGLLPAKAVTAAMLRGSAQHTHLADQLAHHRRSRTILLVIIVAAVILVMALIILGGLVH
jgi:hypothetical protein